MAGPATADVHAAAASNPAADKVNRLAGRRSVSRRPRAVPWPMWARVLPCDRARNPAHRPRRRYPVEGCQPLADQVPPGPR